MSEQLRLDNVRNALIRLEETIIFGLIERAQFRINPIVYKPGSLGEGLGGQSSILDFLLHETEKVHAKLRRYTSPDEHPFFSSLPAPILPPLIYQDNPLVPNDLNINDRIRPMYEQEVLPAICRPGDDGQYGASAVNDVNCLQAISKRVHYGKFVAESKFRAAQAAYRTVILEQNADRLMELITDPVVEGGVLQRVRHKAETYCSEMANSGTEALDPIHIVRIYSKWIIPMNKEVQVQYLLRRISGAASETGNTCSSE